MDDFRDSPGFVAVGSRDFLHTGRVYSFTAGDRAGRFADPANYGPEIRTVSGQQMLCGSQLRREPKQS